MAINPQLSRNILTEPPAISLWDKGLFTIRESFSDGTKLIWPYSLLKIKALFSLFLASVFYVELGRLKNKSFFNCLKTALFVLYLSKKILDIRPINRNKKSHFALRNKRSIN